MPPLKASPKPLPGTHKPFARPAPKKPAPQACPNATAKYNVGRPKVVNNNKIATAQAYFKYMQDVHQQRNLGKPVKVKIPCPVNHNNGKDYLDIVRSSGGVLRVSRAFMACFYDLTVGDTIAIFGISERSFRYIKDFCKINKWPKQFLTQGQGVLSYSNVRQSRLEWMKWSYEQRDEYTYELLYRAHQAAGCSLVCLPPPGSVPSAGSALPDTEPEPEPHQPVPVPAPYPEPRQSVPVPDPEPHQPVPVPVPVPHENQPALDLEGVDFDFEGVDWSQLFM